MADFNETIVWHKVNRYYLDETEKQELIDNGWVELPKYVFETSEMPDDGQEILVSTDWGVCTDICNIENMDFDGFADFTLEGCGDWDDVIAWAAMPKGVRE